MELDYIENVNGLEEHVVRLYNFNMAEAIHFRALLIEFIIEKQQPLDLSQVAFIKPRNCNLILGLRHKPYRASNWILSESNKKHRHF